MNLYIWICYKQYYFLLLNQSSNEKVPNMKVVQLFKIYNFDVVQKFISSMVKEYFLKT